MRNISRVKIIISIIILGIGLISSFFMVFNSLPEVGNAKKSAKENSVGSLAGVQSPIKWAQNEKNSGVLSAQNYQRDLQQSEENNFTKNLVSTVFNRVQTGSLAENGVNSSFPSDKEISKKFELGFIDSLQNNEIKISQDNSKEAKSRYLELLSEAAKKNYGDFKKDPLEIMISAVQDLNPLPAKEAANIYKNTAKDFLIIEVPSDWKRFHKNLIIYFKNGEIIYSAIAEYYKDPMKGYAAIEKTQEILIQKGAEINKVWQEKYKINE
ncbi:hypothetical protein HZB04_00340 [Candidatus Wolfebacteria bacterium]|nr:hypothetical protein [Candidatus Wolfebacteria bacterium]